MSSSGYVITSSTGANVPPSINESDTTAYNANMQINLNIRPGVDSLETNFTQAFDKQGIWKYNSSAENPLAPPVHQMRVRTAIEEQPPNENWKNHFDFLVDHLPVEIRDFFRQQMTLPLDQRLPSMVDMENSFILAAKFLAALEAAAAPEQAGTIKADMTQLNLCIPLIVERNVSETGSEVMNYIRDMLDSMNHNHPFQDHHELTLQQSNEALHRLFTPIEAQG